MKYLLPLLALLPTLAVPAPAWAALDQAAYVSLAASVLRVEAPRQRGGFSLGSAVALESDKVVTNCHVTRDATAIHILRGGLRYPARWQASDIGRDLCLLDVPGLGAQPVALGRAAELTIGQPVTALGYTGGMGIQNSTGAVIQLHRHDGSRVIQSSNFFNSGASGGGLFDDDGRLVGILTFRLRGGESHYFAAPVEWVAQMLADAQRGSFRQVMPLDSQQLPYWQTHPASQPRFLQAAVLVRNDRWPELEALARDWLRAEPDDTEPRQLLATALARQGRADEAGAVLERARVTPIPSPAPSASTTR
ncbi:trypsin-like peptidase domain-containing protein [Variovorax sp. YR752]|uniref:S1 family peptidase n=1 Tax=Variovorax sp. YR752 TaxID=1884383 RepID=UPI0031382009